MLELLTPVVRFGRGAQHLNHEPRVHRRGATRVSRIEPSSLAFDYVSAYASSRGTDSPVPLIDTRKGDVVYLTQLEASSLSVDGGEDLRLLTLVKSAQLSPITLASGTTKITGVFSAPTQSTSVAIEWRRSAYWAQGPEVTPNYVFDSAYELFSLVAIPYFGDEGVYRSAATLLVVGGTWTKGQSSDLAFTRTIWNPYPPSWSLAAYRQYCHFGPVQTAGGTRTIQRGGCSVEWDSLDAVNGQPLTPRLSPPRDLRVDGQPAYGALTLTRTSPTVTWTAPTVGSVDWYELLVQHVYNSGLDSEWVAYVLTRGTSLVIPPGVLEPEAYYFFFIVAQNGVDIATPSKTSRSRKYATGVSGVLRVQ